MESYDIVIIGAGPAGLTAGMYAGRQNSKTLVIDKGMAGGLGLEVPMMQNYPGFDLIAGMELIQKMKAQSENYCEILENTVIESIEKTADGFNLKTKNSPLLMTSDDAGENEFFTKTIIFATGSSHRHLNVPGEEEFLGRGVAYCATCDGMFFIGRDVLTPLYILDSFVKNKVPLGAWVYFWTFYLVPLVYILFLCQYHNVLMTIAL